ncbi:hypothetical protein ACFYO6_38450 [Streptomyces anthocyanicus]|uniref:hypothetical protein n=1 Tax=Streptomyces TaxID=1883 RepID=UPI00359B7F79
MANLADEYGTDVEIYMKALTTTIHADTPTELHDLLEQLGLERHTYPEPLCIWHTVPEHIEAHEHKRLATRVIPALLAGYTVNCDPDFFDEAVYQQAEHEALTSRPAAAPRRLTSAPVAPPASPRRVL